MRDHLRAGVALYNDGHVHAAHDAWEDRWLSLDWGTDERFLHGLIQFTAAVYHVREGNTDGATGLAESAASYLDGIDSPYRGVALDPVRTFLDDLADSSGTMSSVDPPALRYEGDRVTPADLDRTAAWIAAPILAQDVAAFDGTVVETAVEYARDDPTGDRSPFAALVHDFVRHPDRRPLVHDRLGRHVDRRTSEDDAVDGLFR